jgi:hypothetical protein
MTSTGLTHGCRVLDVHWRVAQRVCAFGSLADVDDQACELQNVQPGVD